MGKFFKGLGSLAMKAAPILASGSGIGGLLLPVGLELLSAYRRRNQPSPAQQRRQFQPQYNFSQQQQYSPFAFGPMPMGFGGIGGLPTPGYPGGAPSYSMYGSPQRQFAAPQRMGSPRYGSRNYAMGDNMTGGEGQGMQLLAHGGKVKKMPDSYADGGVVNESVVTEGMIPFRNDGSMESSGAVDDRLAVAKPDMSEVTIQTRKMLETLKYVLENPDNPASIDIITLAEELYGEELIEKIMRYIDSEDMSMEDDMDLMVEMEFQRKLANGDELQVAAAVAPGEFIMTKDAADKATNLTEVMRQLEGMDGPARLEVRSA
jgi:hypothetical protein